MTIELGIVVDLSGPGLKPGDLAELARRAESGGLDLVVLHAGDDGGGLDPWTTAVWVAGQTRRIAIGVVPEPPRPGDPTDSETPYPRVVDKARQSLEILAGPRLITDPSAWVTATSDADADELRARAQDGRPVVVPVRSAADVDRLVALVGEPDRAGRPRRSAVARARRRSGIDYDGVPESLADAAVEPGDPQYRSVASTYLRGGSPGLVLRPRTPEQVADALAFARRHRHLPLGLRSGGHGISGRSTNDGGIIIDVSGMNTIEVLDPALNPYGWALGSGDYGGVGVGGLATAGGIGFLSRKYGLTIDHLRAVELVLADGRFVRASREENADLFWAVRGAGANFGVATAFEFEVDEVRAVGFGQLVLVNQDIEEALRLYGRLASTAPRDTTVFLVTGRPRIGQAIIQLYALVDSGDPDVVVERLTPFTEIGRLAQQQVVLARYTDVMDLAADVGADGHHGVGEPVSRSALLPALTDEFARDAAQLLHSGRVAFFQLRAMGGAIADVSADETAFAHRTAAFQVTAMGVNQNELNAFWDRLAHHFDGLYLSFDTDLRPARLRDAFPPPVLARLVELKRRYDPEKLFRDNFAIDPQLDVEADLAAATADS